MRLAENIRFLRKERSLTQARLAEALGVTASAVYKWEAGLCAPDLNLIVELADFFDSSVDALLGYEVKDNKWEAAVARLKEFARRRDEHGLDEADKLLRRYPNRFEIVYYSADLYWLFGFMRRDQKLLRRCVRLMERAFLLVGQNTDPEISELSIQYSIARAYSAMGEDEKAVALFRRHNPRGIHNDLIGHILGTACDRPDEAVPYLSRALLRCITSLDHIVIGYFHVYCTQRDFSAATDILRFALRFFSDLKKPGQNSYLDKASAELHVYLAAALSWLGDADGARESLRTAKALAEQFDRAPDYSVDSIRFVANDRPGSAFDNMGDTAMDCIAGLLHTGKYEALMALWEEITAGEDGRNGRG